MDTTKMNIYEIIYDMLKGKYCPGQDISNARIHEEWCKKYLLENSLAKTAKLVDPTNKELRKTRDIYIVNQEDTKELVEAKRNIMCYLTKNTFIETESHGEYSGITTTHSHIWFDTYMCHDGTMRCGLARTEEVKKLINTGKYKMTRDGAGDAKRNNSKSNKSKEADGFIVPWKDYHTICFHTSELDAVEYIKQIGLENELNRRLQNTKPNFTW